MNQKESENQALHAELEYRQQPIELNPQILKNVFKETGLKPDWQVDIINFWRKISSSLKPDWKVGVSVMASLVAVVFLIKMIPPEQPQPIVKSPPSIPQQIAVSNPQATSQTLQIELTKLGIVAELKTVDNGWMVKIVNLSTDNPEALSALLTKHDLVLPPPNGESGLKIRVVAEER
ncbi:hypothetical protein QUF74_10945 [Candidatus Halobeggiatoa sp. HSG11]|nr:hypothetical protein [Candidatus Halobeggiatoa sp. HSG11]